MDDPKHSFGETNLVLQLIQELQIKNKVVMSWSSQKKKEGIFLYRLFVQRIFFNICVLSQCILYCIHFQNICTFTYQKTLLHIILLLVFKTVESLQYILKRQKLRGLYTNAVLNSSGKKEMLFISLLLLCAASKQKRF